MEFISADAYEGDIENVLTYYVVGYENERNQWVEDAFSSWKVAVDYAIHLDKPASALTTRALFVADNGRMCKEDSFESLIPNLTHPTYTYYEICSDEKINGDFYEFISFFTGTIGEYDNLEDQVREIFKFYDQRDHIGIYEVTVNLTEDKKSFEKNYKLIYSLKDTRTK